jgi:ligand-binding SRPBCC domain-containing protein
MSMLHELRTNQHIKCDIGTVWDFISSPYNLTLITPEFLSFKIISDNNNLKKMHAGQIIEYLVSPVAGIRMHWVTEITHFCENEYFVDEQKIGPYTLWRHKHFLKEVDGGVEMTDIVHYKAPFGILGDLLNSLFIRNRLKKIFDYRFKKIAEIFTIPDRRVVIV